MEAARQVKLVAEAKARVYLESRVVLNPRYSTIFYGLKKNHPHNVALVHPITFLLRRIVYSAIIIFMFHLPFFASLVLLILSLGFLMYVILERQWQDNLIHQ